MKKIPIEGKMTDAIVGELGRSPLLKDLGPEELQEIARKAALLQYEEGETVMNQGDTSDNFALVVAGEVIVRVRHESRDELIEVARIQPFETIGELGLLLNQPRSATIVAAAQSLLLIFDRAFFLSIFQRIPSFALAVCRVLARRLQTSARHIPIPSTETQVIVPDANARSLLPMEFIQRHRVLPLKAEGNVLHLGFLEDPTPQIITLVREQLPGMELRPAMIDSLLFNNALQTMAGEKTWTAPATDSTAAAPAAEASTPPASSPRLDQLLRRVVAERASDLHLSGGQRPHWRIDGDIQQIKDGVPLGQEEVYELVKPIMAERNRAQFEADNDTDFAYSIRGLARFRVNLFRENRGVGAVFRQIPDKILTLAQLGMPPILQRLCDYPKGLVLVTGPTGSGKSTTLAGMVDHVNKTRKAHIITMEDPIEFVHQSQQCLVNQREVGPHTTSFSRALRAALREDPDIVLVGEMRDLETIMLALETANTGHLVFGTLHTNTAISTIARIIDMFPGEQQNQVRSVLADTLKGVVAQTLCRRIGGGRVAALEIMISDAGIATLIREGKTHQIFSAMQLGKAIGNRMLNEELARLAQAKTVEVDEAMSKALDKADLAQKLGIKFEALKPQP